MTSAHEAAVTLDASGDDQSVTGSIPLPPISLGKCGRYVLLRCLGVGGMGTVYEAFDPALERRVALKVRARPTARHFGQDHIFPEVRTANAAIEDPLLREARHLAALTHPHIVAILDVGTLGRGDLFLAMELVAGKTLRREICERVASWPLVVRWFLQACEALAYAHRHGILHRDLKPENLMVDSEARLRVLDFGLADGGANEAPNASASATSPNGKLQVRLIGTLGYMPPEQLLGAPYDVRGDVFSLCLTFYEMICQHYPLAKRELAQPAAQSRDRHYQWRREVPQWLRKIIEKGLAHDPNERWTDMDALAQALQSGMSRQERIREVRRATTVLAAASALLSVIVLNRSSELNLESRCMANIVQPETLWTHESRAAIHRAYAGFNSELSRDQWNATAANIADWIDAWRSAQASICTVIAVPRTTLAPDHWAREEAAVDTAKTCLEQRLVEFSTAIAGWPRLSHDRLLQAPQALQKLPRPQNCLNISEVRLQAPLPADPELAAQISRLRESLAIVEISIQQAHYEQATRHLKTLAPEIIKRGYLPLAAELASVEAFLANEQNDWARAATALERGLLAAIAGRHQRNAALLASRLTYVRGFLQNDTSALNELEAQGSAMVAAQGSTPMASYALLRTQATLLLTREAFAQSLEVFEKAHAAARAAFGESSSEVALALEEVGSAHWWLGEFGRAEAYYLQAYDHFVALHGAHHPNVARQSWNLSYVTLQRGALDESRVYAWTAIEICLRAGLGLEHCGDFGASAGEAALRSGMLRESTQGFELWRQAQESLEQRGSPGRRWAQSALAETLLHRGDFQGALASARAGLDKLLRESSPSPDALGASWLGLAQAYLAANDLVQADRSLQAAENAIAAPSVEGSGWRPHIRLARAQWLFSQNRFVSAREAYEDAEALHLAAFEPNYARARNYLGLAQCERALHDHERALALAITARRMMERNTGLAAHVFIPYDLELAEIYESLGEFENAMAAVNRASDAFDPTEIANQLRAPILFVQARLKWQRATSLQERNDALATAELAIAQYEFWGIDCTRAIEPIETWLKMRRKERNGV
jgi:serine/threonine protein kinase